MITITPEERAQIDKYLASAAGTDDLKIWMIYKWKFALAFQSQEVWS